MCTCSDSVFTVRYELTLNDTALSARNEQSLAPSQISSVMANITNPGDKPYLVIETIGMKLESTDLCTTMVLSSIIRTSDKASLETAIKRTIMKSLTAEQSMFCIIDTIETVINVCALQLMRTVFLY